jgi:glutathione S-transferase
MLKIWGRKNSLNVQKTMWVVGELGLAHERIDTGGPFGGLETAEFGALNPNRRVPVIDDDGVVVWESHSILRYLAARYGAGTLWAEDAAARSLADRWIDWTLADLQPAFIGGVFMTLYRTPEAQRNWKAIERGLARTAELMALLDRHLADKPFLAGDFFTMGDIPAGAQLYRHFTLEIERPALPNVEAWYGRLTERPAYREHVMVPYDDLRGKLSF